MNITLQLLRNALGERGAAEPKLSTGIFPVVDVTAIVESELRAPGSLRGRNEDEWSRQGRAFTCAAQQAAVAAQFSHCSLSALPYAPGNVPAASLILLDEVTVSSDVSTTIHMGMLSIAPFGAGIITQVSKRVGNNRDFRGPPSAAEVRGGTNAAVQLTGAFGLGGAASFYLSGNTPYTVRFNPAIIIEPIMTVPASEVGFGVATAVVNQNLRVFFQWREEPYTEQPG